MEQKHAVPGKKPGPAPLPQNSADGPGFFASGLVARAERRGRGAVSNHSGRFEANDRVAVDDGWALEPEAKPFRTHVVMENARKIITRNQSPDIAFDRSINPYQGCEHGCVYCYARPTHSYYGLSAGLDFETRLFAKPNAAALLEKELAAPGYQPRAIAIGTNTDAYQPIERQHRIMRSILEVLERTSHPVGIVTKSALILRDLDILKPMAERGLVKVAISVTSLDHKLSRIMEPRASAPGRRIETIRALAKAGIPTSVMVAPIIPAINDMEIEKILKFAASEGARGAGYVLLRLPREISELFREWLHEHFPDRAAKVMAQMRDMRGGADYDATWGLRMRGTGPYAWAIGRRFEIAAKRAGLNRSRFAPKSDLFVAPAHPGQQLDLFKKAS